MASKRFEYLVASELYFSTAFPHSWVQAKF
uniref:Uncharacterized protein n=1 Tax=Anguilla anguilla TaxID=7936 RepID=A0A0E9RAJ7_ANGAN